MAVEKPPARTADRAADQQPTVGRIVRYRTRAGIDIAAIITGTVGMTGPAPQHDDPTAVHLQTFPPPGVSPDALSYEYGTAYGNEPGTWHWPERA